MTINSNSTQMVDGWPTFFSFFSRNRNYLTIFHGLPFGICNIAMENGRFIVGLPIFIVGLPIYSGFSHEKW